MGCIPFLLMLASERAGEGGWGWGRKAWAGEWRWGVCVSTQKAHPAIHQDSGKGEWGVKVLTLCRKLCVGGGGGKQLDGSLQ